MAEFQGLFAILPTPFDRDYQVDIGSLRRVIDFFIEAGANGLTALGVNAEPTRLNDYERNLILDTVLGHVDGRVPVVIGATAGSSLVCIEHARRARAAGAAGVMIIPPRMPKLSADAVLEHFGEIASAVDVDIVVQDFPPMSGYTMEPDLLRRIAQEIPAARTIELEDHPSPVKITHILGQAKDIPIRILGGLGAVFLLEELVAGAAGTMTGFAYPEILVNIIDLFKSGQTEAAAEAFFQYVPLMRFEYQEGIGLAIRKEILRRRGVIADGRVRPPGSRIDPMTQSCIDRMLRWLHSNQETART